MEVPIARDDFPGGLGNWALAQVFPAGFAGVNVIGGQVIALVAEDVIPAKVRAALEGAGALPVEADGGTITATTTTACDYAVLQNGAVLDEGQIASENGAAVLELIAEGTFVVRFVQRAAPYRSGEIEVTL